MAAALSRIAATSVSFILCLVYLLILPFHVWGMAALIGVGALAVTLMGRPGDTITTGITTAVVMVTAAANPHHAWEQPILRMADTIAGIAVGVAAAWIGLRAVHRLRQHRSQLEMRNEARHAIPGAQSSSGRDSRLQPETRAGDAADAIGAHGVDRAHSSDS